MALFGRKNRQPTNKDQEAVRQSSPKPTLEEGYVSLAQRKAREDARNEAKSQSAPALAVPIGTEQIHNAYQILMRYKAGKSNLERRIIANEQWYKLRHWECLREKAQGKNKVNQIEPASGWLFNALANKHADAMDNFPSPNILPREENDKAEAEKLSAIIPVILDQADFEGTYSSVADYKSKFGTGVYGVFWDAAKLNGLGDISITQADLLSLYWEPGITDIQASRNLFSVELMDNDTLISLYPQLAGKLGGKTVNVADYIHDDTVDTSNKSVVVDWYYKRNLGRRQILHYCKFVNQTVLFATENEPDYQERGWYDHGLYPFIFDPLFRDEGTPTGLGYIDIGKSAQEYIDRGNQAILQNTLANARPRFFIRSDGSVNEEEFADQTRDFVHVDGALGADSIQPISGKPLSSVYVEVINNKIDELKEITGNRDISTGGTSSGVTAASAIAAMQEAGSKLSRDSNKAAYRAYRKMILMVIELIRQFYSLPRCFRIMGEDGAERYVQYTNAALQAQSQGMDFGVDMGLRKPLFDVEVSAQKASPYSKMSQNELALQFYSAGFFNPQLADQALACLDMMDFDRKQMVIKKVSANGTMYQQLLAMQQQMILLAQMVDQTRGSNIAQQLAAQFSGAAPVQPIDGRAPSQITRNSDVLGGESKTSESKQTKDARQRVADSTSPT